MSSPTSLQFFGPFSSTIIVRTQEMAALDEPGDESERRRLRYRCYRIDAGKREERAFLGSKEQIDKHGPFGIAEGVIVENFIPPAPRHKKVSRKSDGGGISAWGQERPAPHGIAPVHYSRSPVEGRVKVRGVPSQPKARKLTHPERPTIR